MIYALVNMAFQFRLYESGADRTKAKVTAEDHHDQ